MNVVVMGAMMILMWAVFHGRDHHGPNPKKDHPAPSVDLQAPMVEPRERPQKNEPINKGDHPSKGVEPKNPPEVSGT